MGSGKVTYRHKACIAEAGATIEPVIMAELVDLDAPLVGGGRGRMRHGLCHHRLTGRRAGDVVAVGLDRCAQVKVELVGRQGEIGLGRVEEYEGRQGRGVWSARCSRRKRVVCGIGG